VGLEATIRSISGNKRVSFLLLLLDVIRELCGRYRKGVCIFFFASGKVLQLFLDYELELELLLLWKTWRTRLNLVSGRRVLNLFGVITLTGGNEGSSKWLLA